MRCKYSTFFAVVTKKKQKMFAGSIIMPTFAAQKQKNGALAHLARAFDWQSRGGEFESRMLHKTKTEPADIQRVSSFSHAEVPF